MKFSDLIPMGEPADSLSVIYGAVMFAVDFCKHFGLNYDLLRLTFEDLPADRDRHVTVAQLHTECERERQYVMNAIKEMM